MSRWFIVLAAALVTGCTSGGEDTATTAEPTEPSTPSAPSASPPPTDPGGPEEVLQDSFEDGYYSSGYFNIRFQLPDAWELVDTRSDHAVGEPPGSGQPRPDPPAFWYADDEMMLPTRLGRPGPLGIGRSYDSLTFVGPEGSGLYMVIANTNSVALAGTTYENLTETVTFERVNILPEHSRANTLDGVPGYRAEGDALLRGEPVPIAFMSQGVELPGTPVLVTIFLPFDRYSACYGDFDTEVEPAPEGTGEVAPLEEDCDVYFSEVMASVLDSIRVLDLRRARTR